MDLPDGMDIEVIIGYLIFAVILIILIYYLIDDSIYIYKQKNKVSPLVVEGRRLRNLILRDIFKKQPKKKQNIYERTPTLI